MERESPEGVIAVCIRIYLVTAAAKLWVRHELKFRFGSGYYRGERERPLSLGVLEGVMNFITPSPKLFDWIRRFLHAFPKRQGLVRGFLHALPMLFERIRG